MTRTDRVLSVQYGSMQLGYWMDYLTIFSFTAVFLKGRGFSTTEIGYVTTAGALLSILLQTGLSSLADRSERISLKQILLAMLLGGGLGSVGLMLLPQSHWATFVFMFVTLSLTNSLQPLMTSLCLQYNAMGHRVNFGVARSIGSLGYAAAGFIMGRVTEAFGAEIILPIYGALTALLFLLTASMKNPEKVVHGARSSQSSSLIAFFRKYKRYDMFLLAVILMFFMQMVLNTYMIYFMNGYGGGEADMGLALSIGAFAEMPAVALGMFFLKKFSAEKLMRASAIAGLIKFGGMVFIPNSTWFIALTLTHFCFSGFYSVAGVYFANSIVQEKDAVKAQAILAVSLTGVAGIIANIAGGYMIENLPLRAVTVLGAVTSLLGVVVMFIVTGKRWFREEPRADGE